MSALSPEEIGRKFSARWFNAAPECPQTIAGLVAAAIREDRAELARERREEELREDERLGKMMARAEAAEQALTSERQRREEAEAVIRFYLTDQPNIPEHLSPGSAHFRKYEPGK